MEKSVIQIKNEFELVATAHKQINSFFWGDFDRAVSEEERVYPFLCCTLVPFEMTVRETLIEIQVTVSDRLREDFSNYIDVQSDTFQTMKDIQSIIHLSRWQSIATAEDIQRGDHFIFDKGTDYIAGWSMLLRLQIVDRRNRVNMPLTGYDPNIRY